MTWNTHDNSIWSGQNIRAYKLNTKVYLKPKKSSIMKVLFCKNTLLYEY